MDHPLKKNRIASLATVALCLALAACQPTPTESGIADSPSAPEKAVLTVGATLEPASMDPFHNTAASIPQVLLYNVYETLVKVDSTGEIRPLLAQNWEVSADRTQYTFFLNPAAKFASGEPVDAAAVVANIERLQADVELTGTLKFQLEVIESAAAIDSQQVVIKLKRPSLMWLYDMSSTLGMIVDPAAGDISNESAGSGPYAVAGHAIGQSVTLAKNESYWGTPGRFDEVVFRYFGDPNAMNASLLGGELDIISNLQAPDALPQFSDTSRFTVTRGTTNGEVVLGLNHQTEALANADVRKALTMAIDRKLLLSTVWNNEGTLIGSMAVPTDPWYEDLSDTVPYDPEAAKALLKEAGYEKGLKLRLRVPVVPYATKAAQVVYSQLRDVGVEATIEELDFDRWVSEVLGEGAYDLTIVAHVEARDLGKFADPTYYWHNDDPTFAQLYAAADAADTEQEAISLMKQACRRLADEAAAIWLWSMPNLVITKAGVTGVEENATTLSFDLSNIAVG